MSLRVLPDEQLAKLSPPSHSVTLQAQTLSVREALCALLNQALTVTLVDGRVFMGRLLCVDRAGSLVLSTVREFRPAGEGVVAENVQRYYPSSREGLASDEWEANGSSQSHEQHPFRGRGRVRDMANVLVPMQHVVRIQIEEEDGKKWADLAGVQLCDGIATVGAPGRTSNPVTIATQTSTASLIDHQKE